jgi:hypothetical protein
MISNQLPIDCCKLIIISVLAAKIFPVKTTDLHQKTRHPKKSDYDRFFLLIIFGGIFPEIFSSRNIRSE